MTDLVHRYGPALDGAPAPAPEAHTDDIQALMAPSRTPNVYAALEDLRDDREAEEREAEASHTREPAGPRLESEPPAAPTAMTDPADDVTSPASSRVTRDVDWSALGAESVGPDHLRWRREDDDIIASAVPTAGRRKGLRLLHRS